MAIKIEDRRTITLTGADQFTTTVRVGLLGEETILVERLSYVRGSTGRLGRTVRLWGRPEGNHEEVQYGSLWLAELPEEMAYALTDERPSPIEFDPEPDATQKEPTDD